MTDHPPKPQLTLRVGVTGHRPNKLSNADLPRIEQQLRDTFATIETAVAKAYEGNRDFYAGAPAPGAKPYRIRLISGFAEGADQLAAAACPADWTVEAILPFPKDEYLKDFETSAAGDGRDVRDEFLKSLARAGVVTELPTPEVRNQGYVLCGNFLLRQIDVLIAVWDGEAPKPGGTGAIAQEACDGGIPVVWVATGGDHPVALINSFIDGKAVRAKEAWSAQTLQRSLDPILAAPSADAFGQRSQRQRLEQFYAESWPAPTRASSFDLLKRWTTGQRPLRLTIPTEPRAAMVARFSEFVDEAPAAGPLSQRLKDVLAPRHAWADALAVQFSHLYRNAYVLAYLLAAAAVLIAVIGAYVEHAILKLALVALELFVVVSIIQLVRYGGSNAWHERWIDYRLVAESLRYARFLAYVSEFGLVNRRDLTGQPWTIWYIRATLREIGLPNARARSRLSAAVAAIGAAQRGPRSAPLARDQHQRDGEGRPLPAPFGGALLPLHFRRTLHRPGRAGVHHPAAAGGAGASRAQAGQAVAAAVRRRPSRLGRGACRYPRAGRVRGLQGTLRAHDRGAERARGHLRGATPAAATARTHRRDPDRNRARAVGRPRRLAGALRPQAAQSAGLVQGPSSRANL